MLILEAAINRYLALDPEMRDKLGAFSGKVIKMEVTGFNKAFYIFPSESGIAITAEYEGTVDTVLRGSAASFFKMGLVENTAPLLLKGEVEISGDTRLGHQFKNVLNQMDVDWSEPLAELVGDGLAFQLQQIGSKLNRWGKTSVQSLSSSVSEYLQEESRDVVSEAEMTIFNDSVDKLRNDVERMQKKIQLLLANKE